MISFSFLTGGQSPLATCFTKQNSKETELGTNGNRLSS